MFLTEKYYLCTAMIRKLVLFLLVFVASQHLWSQARWSLQRLTVEDGLPSNTVRNIVQDERGFIWLGTDNGLCRYDGTQVSLFRISENGMDQYISALQEKGDSLIVSTQNGVFIFSFRTESFHRLHEVRPQQTGRGDRLQTHDGRLWIGTWDEGLMLMTENGQPEQIVSPLKNGFAHHIHKLFEYAERYILIGCDEGLVAYDMETREVSLWDGPKFVYAIECDDEGGLWLGTFYDGVYYLNDTAHRFGGMPGHVVSRFCEDNTGRLWIASDDAGLRCMVDHVFRDYPGSTTLSNENVHALQNELRDNGNRLWVGTYSSGIYRLEENGLRQYTIADGLYDNSSYVICLDEQSQLWAATMEGICRYEESTDRFIPVKRLKAVAISMISIGQQLWIATQGAGLYCFDGKTWKRYLHSEKTTTLSDNQVNCLLHARDGRLWVATQSGLCLYQPKTDDFRRINNESVSSIVESDQGNELWLATTKGILKFVPTTGESVVFTREDGILSTQFPPNAGFRDSKGFIYFGTVNGFCQFLPTDIHINSSRPRVYITGLEIYNQYISVGDKLLPEALPYGGLLELDYSDRMFSLHYAALSYVSPSKNQYAYLLEGFDREWNYVGSQTKATYTNLPAGTYKFRVKATNNDGQWSADEATIVIVVSPPFWWSWPAKLLYMVLLIGAVWYYVRLQLHQAERKHQTEIQRLSEVKEQEAREARLNFFTTIAHEIRTPVTLIIGPLENLMKKGEPSTDLELINRNAHRLLELVNQLLDFRKVEQKEMPMRFKTQNVYQLINDVCERFSPTFAQNNIQFEVEYPNKYFTEMIDAEAITKVISNLLTNANKYTKSRVIVRCFEEPDNNSFCIEVEDDGVGIAEGDRERIFKPFFQAADNKPGTGIGLSIVQNIVYQHGGTISVESKVGQGSKFIIVLPLIQPQQDTHLTVSTENREHGGGGTLLIVDDQQDMLDYLAGHFQQQYTVMMAHDGLEALDLLSAGAGNVSLIVSDWMMPRMDGAEFCRRVRQNTATSHIPFIMLTAKTDDESKINSMNVGADAYVEKPFSIHYLDGIIRNTLAMRRKLLEAFTREPLEPLTKIASNSTDNEFLVRMNSIIEQNFSNPDLNVSFLAEQLAISRSGLFAKIKTMTELTPNEMIQIVRLKRAAQLLHDNNLTVSEVCYKVGFSSPSYFTKCFQKQFGIKPTEWKEKVREA